MLTGIYQKKSYQICRDEKDISELLEDSTDIFKRSIIDRYIDPTNVKFSNGKYAMLNGFCFAEFLRYYYLVLGESKDNAYQPKTLQDDLIEKVIFQKTTTLNKFH